MSNMRKKHNSCMSVLVPCLDQGAFNDSCVNVILICTIA